MTELHRTARSTVRLLSALGLLGLSVQALAAPVTFLYAGTVTSATGIFAGQGSTVTGTFSFDSTLVDAAATDADRPPPCRGRVRYLPG